MVFEQIARNVTLPNLSLLQLDWMLCSGEDLMLFLNNHRNLQHLIMEDLDITGTVTFKDVLRSLQQHHSALESFDCNRIAQNSFRIYFDTFGVIHQVDDSIDLFAYEGMNEDFDDFFYDFVDVKPVAKYRGWAEQWEGVLDKIGVLEEDLRVDDTAYNELWRHYTW